VGEQHFDALVVGSGPAGSVAALVLARGGARVALVDKTRFPRDKACGDLIGPRGVQVLDELMIGVARAEHVGDMVVAGPTGREVRLPCYPGETYPGYAIAVPRLDLDAELRDAAVAVGAEPFVGRAAQAIGDDELEGFVLSTGERITADVVVGADGATSRVADAAGFVEDARVLWGFAVRTYVEAAVTSPRIFLWEPEPWHGFPGYGWAFPGLDGRANLGLGLGVLAERGAGARAMQSFGPFLDHLERCGIVDDSQRRRAAGDRLGGWLKMGMVGTTPARGRVMLVGDAAGLVNPLQGEGISQAIMSGRAAAECVLAGPETAAQRYRQWIGATFAPYQSVAASAHAALLPRSRAVAVAGRLLTAPGVGRAVSGGWSIFWNDLLDGAQPRPARALATTALGAGRAVTTPSRVRRWFTRELADRDHAAVSRGASEHGRSSGPVRRA
jgi:geranylgeranyl reductase family protein